MTNTLPPYNEGCNQTSLTMLYQEGPTVKPPPPPPPPPPPVQQSQPLPIMAPSGRYPAPCMCPYCRQSIVTRIEKSNGLVVWLASGGICLLGCALGCCLIPFFIDDLKDTTHYCPNCNRIIGRDKKL